MTKGYIDALATASGDIGASVRQCADALVRSSAAPFDNTAARWHPLFPLPDHERKMEIDLPDTAVFLARLNDTVRPPPSARDADMNDGGHRYVLTGRVDSADIRLAVARIPPRSGLFVFAPRFQGRIAEDGTHLVGRFLIPVPFALMSGVLFLWLAAVAIPTFVRAALGAFPGKAFVDNVAPVIGGVVMFLGITVFAVRQYRSYQRWMTQALHDAAAGRAPRHKR